MTVPSISPPTLVVVNPAIPANNGAGGTPNAPQIVPWQQDFSDQSIFGAAKINPAYAADFIAGRYKVEFPQPGDNTPQQVTNKVATQTLATGNSPNAWKKRTAPKESDAVRFGDSPVQKAAAKYPWAKVWIPPLAMFNDASQWVNRLTFLRPMDKHGNGNSDPPLTAQYFTPPPLEGSNFAAGVLNTQLQLGMMANQAAALTMAASNYFGGS